MSFDDYEANWNRQAGTQADGQTDKPVYWEVAPPNMDKFTGWMS